MATAIEKAKQAYETYNAKVQRIISNADLTTDAKRRMVNDAHYEVQATLQAARQQHQHERDTEIARLREAVFGMTPRDALGRMEARDAFARAEVASTPDELGKLLNRAIGQSDTPMQRTSATIAQERGWHGVTATYVQANPTIADDFHQMEALQQSVGNRQTQMTQSMHFAAPPVPTIE